MTRIVNRIFSILNADSLEKDDQQIAKYGLEVFLLNAITGVGVVSIGILTGYIKEMLIILSVFITFRPLTGGYHAKSFTGCFIGTISIFGAIIFIGEKIMPMLETPVMLGTIWLVLANMFLVGPIKNPVHILENGTYMKLHKKIRKLCMGEVVLCSVWIIFQRSLYSDIHVCAILVVFILMLCGLKIEGK